MTCLHLFVLLSLPLSLPPLVYRQAVPLTPDPARAGAFRAGIPVVGLAAHDLSRALLKNLVQGGGYDSSVSLWHLLYCLVELGPARQVNVIITTEGAKDASIAAVSGRMEPVVVRDLWGRRFRIHADVVTYRIDNSVKPATAIVGVFITIDRIDPGSSFQYTMTPQHRYFLSLPKG